MTADRDAALRAILIDRLSDLRRASRALELSYRRVVSPETIDVLSRSDEGMVEIEALTARFARVVDILVRQTLRTVDECAAAGPHPRAEKRGWVSAAIDLVASHALRNRIAHEYDAEGWR